MADPVSAQHTILAPQTATARFDAGPVHASASVSVTPAGLVAIGALVAAVLLSVPPIIRAAREGRGP
jgi:hypothetical protein